jgi:hypothetical protein
MLHPAQTGQSPLQLHPAQTGQSMLHPAQTGQSTLHLLSIPRAVVIVNS